MQAPLTEENLRWFVRLHNWLLANDDSYTLFAETTGVQPFPLWDQGGWRTALSNSTLGYMSVRPECGASFCQAGYLAQIDPGTEWTADDRSDVWAVPADHDWFDSRLNEGYTDPSGYVDVFHIDEKTGRETIHCSYRATRLLGITKLEADSLFYAPTDAAAVEQRLEEIMADHGTDPADVPGWEDGIEDGFDFTSLACKLGADR